MLYVLAGLTLIALTVIVVLVGFPWLAEENILFTTVKEGTVKTVMHGNSVHKFLMSFAGYHLNDPSKSWYDRSHDYADWEVIHHGAQNDDRYDDRLGLLKYLGLYWVGWPWRANVYVYKFDWNETETDTETGKDKVRSRSELTDFIFISDFTYAVITDAAETSEGLPTDELTLVTAAIRNPYRALFSGEDWMRRVTAAVNRRVRSYVGSKQYIQLISENANPQEFSAPIIELNDTLPDDVPGRLPHGLEKRYGVVIRTADLQTIELTGTAKDKHQAAATAKYTAEREAEAKRAAADATAYTTTVEGTAKANVIEITGDKQAAALRARLIAIEKHGETGVALAGFDAIQEASRNAGSQIIWANNPIVGLAGLLKSEKKKEDEE